MLTVENQAMLPRIVGTKPRSSVMIVENWGIRGSSVLTNATHVEEETTIQ